MIATAQPVVCLDGVGISCQGRQLVACASFDVPPGSVTALLGRNGAGKSSLLRCVLGLQRPTRGAVRVFGMDPWRHRVDVLRRTGVVPEVPVAPPDLGATRLAQVCGSLHRRWDRDAVLARLGRFEVPLWRPFRMLSRGQQGALMLALACGHAPDLLVFDDPTLGLDVIARSAMFAELVHELADRGTTVLLTTHDLHSVEGLATHVAILHDGAIVERGELEAIKARRGASLEEIFTHLTAHAGERVA
jgi:ABC-2 type transport system ATP-binding protein